MDFSKDIERFIAEMSHISLGESCAILYISHFLSTFLRSCGGNAVNFTKKVLYGLKQRGLVEREFFRWGWKLNICNFRFFGWSNQKMVKNKVVDFKNRHTSF